jgi:hypothetical protein
MVDAFPDKSYTGVVTSVANIGEQLPNADAKVFEVLIKVDGSDPILRPSMTTGNKIITKVINDVTYIPLECVQAGADSIPFVYLRNGDKQIVVLGESNENNVIVEQGMNAGTMVYLSTPAEPEKFKLVGQDLVPIIRERARIKKEEEKKQRDEAAMARLQTESGNAGGGPGMQQRAVGMRGPGAMSPGDTAARRIFTRSGQPGQGNFRRDTVQAVRRMNPSGERSGRQNGTQSGSGDR